MGDFGGWDPALKAPGWYRETENRRSSGALAENGSIVEGVDELGIVSKLQEQR